MTFPELPYNFHDAGVASIQVGPRNEVTLILGLDDPEHQPHLSVYIHFGGVMNFSEVSSFLDTVPRPKVPEAYWTRIEMLDYDTQEYSKHNSLVFRLVLEYVGQILIRCRNVTTDTRQDVDSHDEAQS